MNYYNRRLYDYNHSVVLMVFVTVSAYCCWRARLTGRIGWWEALGLAIGLGALTKYSIAVTGACALVFWLSQRGWRNPLQRRGLLLSSLVALLVFSPNIEWLCSHDFGPNSYAIESSPGARMDPPTRAVKALHCLADQVLNRAMPAWILLVVAVVLSRRRNAQANPSSIGPAPIYVDESRALLLSWGLVPLLFMPLVGLVVGADLPLHWGALFLMVAAPAAVELASSWVQWHFVSLRPAFPGLTWRATRPPAQASPCPG